MAQQNTDRTLRLRPHHICCIPFLSFDDDNLHPEFFEMLMETRRLLTSEPDLAVTVVRGVDDVCRLCPSCVSGRCDSPPIKEDKVRKLDTFLLKDLGVRYGETLTVGEWQSLISTKWPYRLCRICRWRSICGAQVT